MVLRMVTQTALQLEQPMEQPMVPHSVCWSMVHWLALHLVHQSFPMKVHCSAHQTRAWAQAPV